LLNWQAAAEAGQRSIASNHSMAWQYDRQWISSIGRSHRPDSLGGIDPFGKLSVTPRFGIRNVGKRLPGSLLKLGSI